MGKLITDGIAQRLAEIERVGQQLDSEIRALRLMLEQEQLVKRKRVNTPLTVGACKQVAAELKSKTNILQCGCWTWNGRISTTGNSPLPVVYMNGRYEVVSRVLWVCKHNTDLARNVRLFRKADCVEGCINPSHMSRKRY